MSTLISEYLKRDLEAESSMRLIEKFSMRRIEKFSMRLIEKISD